MIFNRCTSSSNLQRRIRTIDPWSGTVLGRRGWQNQLDETLVSRVGPHQSTLHQMVKFISRLIVRIIHDVAIPNIFRLLPTFYLVWSLTVGLLAARLTPVITRSIAMSPTDTESGLPSFTTVQSRPLNDPSLMPSCSSRSVVRLLHPPSICLSFVRLFPYHQWRIPTFIVFRIHRLLLAMFDRFNRFCKRFVTIDDAILGVVRAANAEEKNIMCEDEEGFWSTHFRFKAEVVHYVRNLYRGDSRPALAWYALVKPYVSPSV